MNSDLEKVRRACGRIIEHKKLGLVDDIGAWYKCNQCGAQFRTDIKPYEMEVSYGAHQGNAPNDGGEK